VLANAGRVFGIVLIGYYSDMEYATGADHLIYGWVFFAIVLVRLVALGETFRETSVPVTMTVPPRSELSVLAQRLSRPLALLVLLLLLMNAWSWMIQSRTADAQMRLDQSRLGVTMRPVASQDWQPGFQGATEVFRAQVDSTGVRGADVLIALYAATREGSELISSQNQWYRKELWSPTHTETASVEVDGVVWPLQILQVQSAGGVHRSIAYVYALADGMYASGVKAKLAQTLDVVSGGAGAGAVIAVSIRHRGDDAELVRRQLESILSAHGSALRSALPWAGVPAGV
jgi:EpsI family protein